MNSVIRRRNSGTTGLNLSTESERKLGEGEARDIVRRNSRSRQTRNGGDPGSEIIAGVIENYMTQNYEPGKVLTTSQILSGMRQPYSFEQIRYSLEESDQIKAVSDYKKRWFLPET